MQQPEENVVQNCKKDSRIGLCLKMNFVAKIQADLELNLGPCNRTAADEQLHWPVTCPFADCKPENVVRKIQKIIFKYFI